MYILLLALGTSPALVPPQQSELLRGGPLHYDAPASAGLVERVVRQLEEGQLEIAFDPNHGYLPGLLEALDIRASSQMLVFSRTSFQDSLISPATPRAIYFGDEAYIGAIPGAPIVEITSMDPLQGPVFYTLEQNADQAPRLMRRDSECLQCHATSRTRDWPGNLVRSVHPDKNGRPILRSGTENVTHSTAFEKRWGGWYVTGTHGEARHRGNSIADERTEMVDTEPGANIESLDRYLETEGYLAPHSDIVALMVFEHQAEMHNRIARANYEVRLALHRQEEMNLFLGEPADALRPVTERILRGQAEILLEYMLFADEILLPAPIRGTSAFGEEFTAHGMRDKQGRSLRDLDLKERLFRYPCSYMVHTPSFNALPEVLLEVVYSELWGHLNAVPKDGESVRLSPADRTAVREILLATKSDLPKYWR